MKAAALIPAALIALYLTRRGNTMNETADRDRLQHFVPSEFRGWYHRLSRRLALGLDAFRARWGHPVMISPAPGAIGRNLGPDAASQHNVDRWGEVRAIDVMPLVREGWGTRGATVPELQHAYAVARSLGLFGGIGVYPDWHPYPGLHLDVRTDRDPAQPALWAGIDHDGGQVYRGIEAAWA